MRRMTFVTASFLSIWVKSFFPALVADRSGRLKALNTWGRHSMSGLDIFVRVRGKIPDTTRGILIVANHVSWLDIPALASVQGALFVAQTEVISTFMFGGMCQRLGFIFIKRGNFRDAARTSELVKSALSEGWPVILFPEGITTDGSRLEKFHSAVIQAAIDASKPVQPVAIRYLSKDGALNPAAPFLEADLFGRSLKKILRQDKIIAQLSYGEPIFTADATRSTVTLSAYRSIAASLKLRNP
jgi:1-acyl-sn-glycerol-3-phosphate acyltransferase